MPLAEMAHGGKSRKEQDETRIGASEPLSCVSSTAAAGKRVYMAFNKFDMQQSRQQAPYVHSRC